MNQQRRLIIGGIVAVGLFVISLSMPVSMGKKEKSQFPAEMPGKPGVRSAANVQRDALYGSIPLYFIPNKGQVDKQAAFYARTPHYTLWLTAGELVFDSPASITRDVSRLTFLGSNPETGMVPMDITSHRVNYYRGKDPSKWLTEIPTSKAVLYENLYHRINLKVYGQEKQVEYDWIVKPGADPRDIRFRYQGIAKTHIDDKGDLIVETKTGRMVHKKPVSHQVIGGEQVPVESTFAKAGENTYQFAVENYDPRYELVIDPVVTLIYSTYLNDTGTCYSIAVDSNRCAYVAGVTWSTNFPTVNAYDNTYNDNGDVFVTKFSSNGQSLVYSTYLGGSGLEEGYGIAVANTGCAYITGYTDSTDFPTADAIYGSNNGNRDAFVTKLSQGGNSILYSTYLGGDVDDIGYAISVDNCGCACVTGYTYSDNFPTYNAIQDTMGNPDLFNDAFVTKLSPDGDTLIYSTYLGGECNDEGYDIVVDSSGCAYITGYTCSGAFPAVNYFQQPNGAKVDAFVTKISSSGNSLVYSTGLGSTDFSNWPWGCNFTYGCGIDVDSNGCAYVTGYTYSRFFPTLNFYQGSWPAGPANSRYQEVFVTKFSPAGNSLVYSTYLGGHGSDCGWGISVDSEGCAYVTGQTDSQDFPILNAFQSQLSGPSDAFVTKFSPEGNSLVYSTYLGGSGGEVGWRISLDICACAYVAGSTGSTDFPTVNPLYPYLSPAWNGFVTKLTHPE